MPIFCIYPYLVNTGTSLPTSRFVCLVDAADDLGHSHASAGLLPSPSVPHAVHLTNHTVDYKAARYIDKVLQRSRVTIHHSSLIINAAQAVCCVILPPSLAIWMLGIRINHGALGSSSNWQPRPFHPLTHTHIKLR